MSQKFPEVITHNGRRYKIVEDGAGDVFRHKTNGGFALLAEVMPSGRWLLVSLSGGDPIAWLSESPEEAFNGTRALFENVGAIKDLGVQDFLEKRLG